MLAAREVVGRVRAGVHAAKWLARVSCAMHMSTCGSSLGTCMGGGGGAIRGRPPAVHYRAGRGGTSTAAVVAVALASALVPPRPAR